MLGGEQQLNKQQLKEIVLKDLYKEIKNFKKSKEIKKCNIVLGEIDEPEDQEKIPALKELEKEGIIQGLSVIKKEEEYLDEDGVSIDIMVTIAECKLKPNELIKYINDLLKKKKESLDKLSELILKSIEIINFHIKNPLDKKEEINDVYTAISKDISEILRDEVLYDFKRKYKKPFTNIFLAEKELQNNGSNMSSCVKNLSILLGDIDNNRNNIQTFIGNKKKIDIDKIIGDIRNNYELKSLQQKSTFVITRDMEGDFYYKGRLVKLRNKEKIYAFILECLCDRPDGFATYKQINEYLVEKGKGRISEFERQKTRIRNGLKALFRYSSLKNENKDEIIRVESGRGLHICKLKN